MSRPQVALWLFLGYGVFVVYGSLVPLDFHALPFEQAWQSFQNIPFLHLGLESRADWVANGVLYAPLAFFGARAAFDQGLAWGLALGLALVGCCALAVGVEFTQLFFPPRTVSQNDIIAECIGSAVGALAAPFLAAWTGRLGQAWVSGGGRLGLRLLEFYTASYLLLCFFPYDFLLSVDEVLGKWQGQGWGWWLAPQARGPFFTVLQLGVELVLVLPIGALLARRGTRSAGSAAVAGAVLGLCIEVGQFFVESGVSQGASVLSRTLGVMAGVPLAQWLRGAGIGGLRAALRPCVPALGPAYLVLLAAVNGAFRQAWHGVEGAQATWQATRLLPFYYHYYTTEAAAVFSLGSVALMYAPLALLGWARAWTRRAILSCTALLAGAVEVGKLFVDTLHPDPTNVVIAVAANALVLVLLAMGQHPVQAPPASPSAPKLRLGSAWLLVLPVVLAQAFWFPAFSWPLLALLLAAAAAVWHRPALALLLVPAAMPVLDFAPWSGRFFWDEFDLFSAACLAVAFHRSPARAGPRRARPLTAAFALLGLSLALSTVRALWPLPGLDDDSFSTYTSAYNALRIVKGAVWAWLFARLWQRLHIGGGLRSRLFATGMLVGLGLTVAVVLWERAAFASLWDFAADFRVTGPFSAMHKGGAYIECYLAVASAFATAAVLRAGRLPVRIVAVLMLAGACYAMMVTYSRNGYAALLAVLAVSLLPLLGGRGARPATTPPGRAWPAVLALLAVVAAIAWPVLGGTYARQRLAQSGRDLAVRQAHWSDGLALRTDGTLTALIGMGIGRFPDAHFWRSREPVHAASYRLGRDGDVHYLRLAQGATLYVEQIIARPRQGGLRLAMDLRAVQGPSALAVTLCEKWMLTSRTCASVEAPAAAGAWQHLELPLDASAVLSGPSPMRAPLQLALATPAQGVVDVTHLRLETAQGQSLLANGDFAQGMDRWFFATDVDPPWHLHGLPLAVLFDQGWFGVLAWTAVLVGVCGRGLVLAWRGQAEVPAALAALAGFAVSGTLNTLIDAPRFLWLLLLLLWLTALRRPGGPVVDRGAETISAP